MLYMAGTQSTMHPPGGVGSWTQHLPTQANFLWKWPFLGPGTFGNGGGVTALPTKTLPPCLPIKPTGGATFLKKKPALHLVAALRRRRDVGPAPGPRPDADPRVGEDEGAAAAGGRA